MSRKAAHRAWRPPPGRPPPGEATTQEDHPGYSGWCSQEVLLPPQLSRGLHRCPEQHFSGLPLHGRVASPSSALHNLMDSSLCGRLVGGHLEAPQSPPSLTHFPPLV